jgi:hypothetical protein
MYGFARNFFSLQDAAKWLYLTCHAYMHGQSWQAKKRMEPVLQLFQDSLGATTIFSFC